MGINQENRAEKASRSSTTRRHDRIIPSTPKFFYEQSDFIWSHPDELDLMEMKKTPMSKTTIDENHFFKVRPSIRRLYTSFNARCPNLYRIHCSDSLQTLQELICFTEEYLHVSPPSTSTSTPSISLDVLLNNDDLMDEFIDRVKFSSFYPFIFNTKVPSNKIDLHCFGSGIHGYNSANILDQTLVFCFELTTSIQTNFLLALEVLIFDPDEKFVLNDIQYINTYDQGYTKLFSCSYRPTTREGTYKILFLYDKIQLIKYSYSVFIGKKRRLTNTNQNFDQPLAADIPRQNEQGKSNSDQSRLFFVLKTTLI